MAEYKTDKQVNYGFGLSFEATGKAPVVAKRIWETLADAQAYVDSATDTAIAGLQLTVINDTDASKNGVYFVKEAAGENGKTVGVLVKLAQGADTSNLQTQITANKQAIDKLNGDEGATGSVKNTAKSYADAALNAVHVKGVKTGDNVISLGSDGKLSSTVAFSIDATADASGKRYLKLTGVGGANLGKVDIADFVKDGMLEGSALYKATAATGKVTINGKEYNLTGLTANHTYIVLVWNTDSSKDAMSIDVTTLIDVYTAGEGLTLTNNQFSVDKTKVAQKVDLDKLRTAIVDGGVSINGYDIVLTDDDGSLSGATIDIDSSDIKIHAPYNSYAAIEDVAALDSVTKAIAKVEGKANKALTDAAAAAKAGVTSVGGQKGDITLDGTGAGSYPVKLTMSGKQIKASVAGLGTAAKHAEGDFATKAQGDKADNSVQYEANGKDVKLTDGMITTKAGIFTSDTDGNNGTKYTFGIQPSALATIQMLGANSNDVNNTAIAINPTGVIMFQQTNIADPSTINPVTLAGVATPTNNGDAANKSYVDSKVSAAMTWATFE